MVLELKVLCQLFRQVQEGLRVWKNWTRSMIDLIG